MASTAAAAPTTGVGQVFMVNPVQSSGNQNLVDDRDSAAAVPGSQYVPVPLRNLDGSGTLTGEIWSRALWDIRGALGPALADKIIVNAQFRFAPGTSFHDAAVATIATAQQMSGAAAANTVRAAFAARTIPGI